MRYDETFLWVLQQERDREAIQAARARAARQYARAQRLARRPRVHPLRRRVGGLLVRAGMWLIAPQACASETATSS